MKWINAIIAWCYKAAKASGIVAIILVMGGCQSDNPVEKGFIVKSVTCYSDNSAIYHVETVKGVVGSITSTNWNLFDIEGPCDIYKAGDTIKLFQKDTVK